MKNPADLLRYILTSVSNLLETGQFAGGQKFKPTQKKALEAFYKILKDESLSISERINLFFTMPQGTGKTPLFIGVIDGAIKAAQKENAALKSMIVVPTIKLLYQTLKRFNEFAPENEKNIGLYGDGHEDRKKPITIITYDSWSKLVDEGRLTEDNVDILISDEAHRGTSAKRTDYIEEFSTALRMGFSATPQFNRTKGVAQTHRKEVFNSSFRDSIELGELAAYFQALLFIIRVLPASRDVVEKAKAEGLKNYESERRKRAWSERVVSILRDTRDPQTKELLSDNQGKIACRDINHIDLTAALINADPVLKARATALGMKDFCVPMHSRLSKKAQKDNQAAYERGEYQFIVSDEQLKEGWDYPPAKVLIDYHHFSYVDKAQILGRIGREWENPHKGRMEGAVAIDILTYTGHPDPVEDAKLRSKALKDAILAWEVLEDVVVFGPGRKEIKVENSEIQDAFSLVEVDAIIGQEVQAYTSLEDLRLIKAEQDNLRLAGEYVELTSEIKDQLRSEVNRTKLSVPQIAGTSKRENPDIPKELGSRPKDLTNAVISYWLRSPRSYIAKKDHLEWVLKFLSLMPDSNLIFITDEMREQLRGHIERTNIGGDVLLKTMEGAPSKLTTAKIYTWRMDDVKTVLPKEWDWVIKAYELLPDNVQIVISEEMRQEFNEHLKRTNIGAKAFMKLGGVPAGFNPNRHYLWSADAKTASASDWDAVIGIYRSLATSFEQKSDLTTPLTGKMRDDLIAECERTLFPVARIETTEGCPDNVTQGKLKCWINGRIKTCDPSEYNWVLSHYKSLPSAIIIDEAKKDLLRELARRTNVNSLIETTNITRLNSYLTKHPERPATLDEKSIKNALNAGYKNARLLEVDYTWMLSTLEDFAERSAIEKANEKEEKLSVTFNLNSDPAKRKVLDDEMERTLVKGGGLASLIANRDLFPDGLTGHMIKNIFEGNTGLIREEHYLFLQEFMAQVPTRIRLTEEDRKKLLGLKEKTGVSFAKAIKGAGLDDALKVSTVNNWASGKSTVAEEQAWTGVISAYLEDKGRAPSRVQIPCAPSRVQITSEMQDKMLEWSNIVTSRLVAGHKGAPENLTNGIIYNWLIGEVKTAKKDHLDYVLVTWPHLVHQTLLSKPAEPKI